MDIKGSFDDALHTVINFLPNLIGFLIILLIGWIVARIVAAIVRRVLDKVGVDRHLHESSPQIARMMADTSASRVFGAVVFWLIFIFFLFSAIGVLNLPAVTRFMNQVLAYLPNVIAAMVIFVVAAILAGLASRAANRVMGGSPTGRIVATVVPALVMVIAMFMILQQLQIAPQIVQIAFAATMGAIALGLALAFGLGGRSVAQRLLEDAYQSAQRDRAASRASSEASTMAYQDRPTGLHAETETGTYSDPQPGSSVYDPGSTDYPHGQPRP